MLSSTFVSFCGELQKLAEDQKVKIDKAKAVIRSRYGITPYLSGSTVLGLALPGDSDLDFAVAVSSRPFFDRLVKKLNATATPSEYNMESADHHVFQVDVGQKTPVDLAITFGSKGQARKLSVQQAALRLEANPQWREKIVANKAKLKKAWILPKTRYKLYKKKVDSDLGLFKFTRKPVDKEASHPLERKDLYGHRTSNLEAIINSGAILSAAEAKKRGLLKDVQSNNPASPFRHEGDLPNEVRKEVFIAKGLMPADDWYGKYGILFRKKKVTASPYLNFVPEEFTMDKHEGKMLFVVPDDELATWKKKHPEHTFFAESEVPKKIQLPGMKLSVPVHRLLSGNFKLWNPVESVPETKK